MKNKDINVVNDEIKEKNSLPISQQSNGTHLKINENIISNSNIDNPSDSGRNHSNLLIEFKDRLSSSMIQ